MAADKTVAGLRVRLEATGLTAGKEAVLRFTLADASTGAPVSDLEPFLGAAGHMLVVNADLTEANHAHPEEQAARGPSVSFHPRMPAAGFYKLWVQFQRKGRVITVPFVVSVRSRNRDQESFRQRSGASCSTAELLISCSSPEGDVERARR